LISNRKRGVVKRKEMARCKDQDLKEGAEGMSLRRDNQVK
jgi:hypothetical protein